MNEETAAMGDEPDYKKEYYMLGGEKHPAAVALNSEGKVRYIGFSIPNGHFNCMIDFYGAEVPLESLLPCVEKTGDPAWQDGTCAVCGAVEEENGQSININVGNPVVADVAIQEKPTPKSPATGEAENTMLWIYLALSFTTAAILCGTMKRKKR